MPVKVLSGPRKALLLLTMLSCLVPLSSVSAREEDPVRYVVTLETAEQPPTTPDIPLTEPLVTYVASFERDGKVLYRLRLGFFASRAEADQVLAGLKQRFPTGWVTRVTKKEKLLVNSGRIASQPVTGYASRN